MQTHNLSIAAAMGGVPQYDPTPRTLDDLTALQRRVLEHISQCADPATGADNSAAMDFLLGWGLIDVDWYGNWYVTYDGKCLLGGVK